MSATRSHLGKVIRESREHLSWSQDQLKVELKLARAISISKWERGEAPVPVHHWQDLMRILNIPKPLFLEAATKDRHRQLSLFMALSQSVRGSASEIGSFTWEYIVRALAPEMAAKMEQLRERYRDLSPAEFAQAAFSYFLEQASEGLDRNNRPIATRNVSNSPPASVPIQGATEQLRGRTALKKHHR
ncbi:MAG: hypothetical protein LZF86_140019 [Nitrospira sp.]|nr:MAG: hypothetical protein LZF86_140019 [Nitrospira sp.]